MKRILLVATILGLTAFTGLAQTNNSASTPQVTPQVASVVDTVKQSVATNLNEVVIQMLSGVKDASGEIYGASKIALAKSVDFAKEQVPDVVHQFIMWSFFDNLVFYLVWLIPSFALIYAAYRAKRYARDHDYASWKDDDKCWNLVVRFIPWVLAVIIFMIDTCNYGVTCVKIAVAPKVYILEYLVNIAQSIRH